MYMHTYYSSVCKLVHLRLHLFWTFAVAQPRSQAKMWNHLLSFQLFSSGLNWIFSPRSEFNIFRTQKCVTSICYAGIRIYILAFPFEYCLTNTLIHNHSVAGNSNGSKLELMHIHSNVITVINFIWLYGKCVSIVWFNGKKAMTSRIIIREMSRRLLKFPPIKIRECGLLETNGFFRLKLILGQTKNLPPLNT